MANAIGASIAQISVQYEQIYVYSKIQRDAALTDAQEKAVQQAELAGAVPGTIELVEVEETPLAYHPENATRLRVKVVGNMYWGPVQSKSYKKSYLKYEVGLGLSIEVLSWRVQKKLYLSRRLF